MKIVGSLEASRADGSTYTYSVWRGEDGKPYLHENGSWVEAEMTPEIEAILDAIPVLEIKHDIGTVIVDTLKDIEEVLELFFGADDEWKDFPDDNLTITVKLMSKRAFDALEPFDP